MRPRTFYQCHTISPSTFDLIHLDIWEPVYQRSARYYVSFIDYHTRNTWIYKMYKRSNFYNIYVAFVTMLHTHFRKSIKYFNFNSRGKYLSNQFMQFFASKEIILRLLYLFTSNKVELLNISIVMLWKLPNHCYFLLMLYLYSMVKLF